MAYTNEDKTLLIEALDLAHDELHNRIATCPDVTSYAEQIAALRDKQEAIADLKARLGADTTISRPAALPSGWVAMPPELTRSMIDAAEAVEEDGYDAMYQAMKRTRPAMPAQAQAWRDLQVGEQIMPGDRFLNVESQWETVTDEHKSLGQLPTVSPATRPIQRLATAAEPRQQVEPPAIVESHHEPVGEIEHDYHQLKVRWYKQPKYGRFQTGDKVYIGQPPATTLMEALDAIDPHDTMFGISYSDESSVYQCNYCEFAIQEDDDQAARQKISHDPLCPVTQLREALQATPTEHAGVPDGVWEALQRLIENGGQLGPASREDALLVAKHRRSLLTCADSATKGTCECCCGETEDAWKLCPEHGQDGIRTNKGEGEA